MGLLGSNIKTGMRPYPTCYGLIGQSEMVGLGWLGVNAQVGRGRQIERIGWIGEIGGMIRLASLIGSVGLVGLNRPVRMTD